MNALDSLHDEFMDKTPHDSQGPVYYRASYVAKALGVSKHLFLDDVAAGRLPVPVRLAHFGASGIAHVNADDTRRLMQALAGDARSPL